MIGLVGVVIGALATSGVTWYLDRDHAKAVERGAERLVMAEVLSDGARVRNSDRPTDAAWLAERERLARSLNRVEWAWVAKYYGDLGRVTERTHDFNGTKRLNKTKRLTDDEPCALAALNVWLYSGSPYYKGLRNKRVCKKPPPTLY